jgi:signal transduction histidine kinase
VNPHVGAVQMANVGRLTRPKPVTTQQFHQLLRVPLSAKLAGANLLIVLVAWGVGYSAHRTGATDWGVLSVMTVALAVGLVVNVVLVWVALRPIRDLEQTATRVWSGDLETRVPRSPVADADLAQVGSTLNFLLNALAQDRARVRMLASEVVRAGDRQRSHVGKELHDSIAQSLAALRYQLIAIEQETSGAATAAKIQAVRASAGDLLEQVRLLSHEVHPQILDDLGLVPALRHLARNSGEVARIDVTVTDDAERGLSTLPSDVAATLYRVAREAAANAIRHGAARTVNVHVGLADGDVTMQVDDDGSGFDLDSTERERPAMGLFMMRERVGLLDGTLAITSVRGKGTSISARIPLPRTPASHASPACGEAEPRMSFNMENQHAR